MFKFTTRFLTKVGIIVALIVVVILGYVEYTQSKAIVALETKPAQVVTKEIVVTATPTATPSASLKYVQPVKKVSSVSAKAK
jgi:cell division protein FtsN